MTDHGSGRPRPRSWPRVAALPTSDLLTWVVCLGVATVVRYEGAVERVHVPGLLITIGVACGLQLVLGVVSKLYQGGYRIASLDQAFIIAVIATVVGGVLLGVDLAVGSTRLTPLSVPFGGSLAALVGMVVVRSIIRRVREDNQRPTAGVRTLVFGAGDGGHQLIWSMIRDPQSPYVPVGLLDDNPSKRHLRISGVRVLGTREDLAKVAKDTNAGCLVVAVPSGSSAFYRQVLHAGHSAGLEVKVLPGLTDLLTPSNVSIRDVRDIDVTDILGRHQIDTDIASIAEYLAGKRVLVTGAGGSIGSELARQIYKYGPSELMLLDRDESALHAVQLSLHNRALLDTDEVLLADIRERDRLIEIFKERRPEVVFHAAALKHVPLLEMYPEEGHKTNVLGTANVLDASFQANISRFVNISTDKAANPTTVLGRTKRMAERLTAHYAEMAPGRYLSVRFGNVLGSRGSVLSSFARQIAEGGPVTVTDPAVTRYFMTIQEAVQLVIQAAAIGRDGEALVLDMGEPVRIADVARQLIEMSGRDIDIVFTGLRSGEKLHEELLGEGEADDRPLHPMISHTEVPPLAPDAVDLTDVIGGVHPGVDQQVGQPVDPEVEPRVRPQRVESAIEQRIEGRVERRVVESS